MRPRLWALVLAVWTAGAQPRPLGQGINFYTSEKEAKLGEMLTAEALRNATRIENPAASAYVSEIGVRIEAALPVHDLTFRFSMVTDDDNRGRPTHEPLAFPGGYVLVPLSLILEARNESEFAGMLAHAMVHCAARHTTRMATRGQLVNNASIPLIFMGGWSGHESLAIPLGFQHIWKELELEADRVAVAAVAHAGWDPDALAAYLSRTLPETVTRSAFLPRAARLAALAEASADLARVATVPPGAFPEIQEDLRPLAKQPERRRAPSLVRK